MSCPDQNQDGAPVSPLEPQTTLAPAVVAEQPEPQISLVGGHATLFGRLASGTAHVPYVAPSMPSSSQTPSTSYVPTSPQIPSTFSAPSSSFVYPMLSIQEEFLRSCPPGELRRISGLWDTEPVEDALSVLRLVHRASGA